jgi:hypothetical protein
MSGANFSDAPADFSEGRASARLGAAPDRRHPVHLSPIELHNRSVIIFVTACTAKRRPILASPSAHDAILAAWVTASTWLVGRYVIMPDHIHLFCAPNAPDAASLERWMRLVLEIPRDPDHGGGWRRCLATSSLGSPASIRRKLRRQMGMRAQ